MKHNKLYSLLAACSLSVLSLATACNDKDYDSYSLNTSYAVPEVTNVTPTEGLPSSIVTITGKNFGSEQHFEDRIGRVYFGEVEATDIVSWSDSEIQVRVPENGQSGQVSVWVWKNHSESSMAFTCVPGAEIIDLESPAYPGSEIAITGKNFGYFIEKGLTAQDVKVIFAAEEGTVEAVASAFDENTIKVVIPYEAKGGKIKVQLGNFQTIDGPELLLVGDLYIDMVNYFSICDKNGKGDMVDEDGSVGNTKNGSYIVYKFEAPATGLFDVKMLVGTTKDGSYLNVNIGTAPNIETETLNDALTQVFPNTGSWSCTETMSWGAFYLKSGDTYYLKVTFLQDGTTWVGNINEVFLTLSADQTQVPVNGGETQVKDYVLYENTFDGLNLYPFSPGWAWEPSYIKIIDGYCEFYFDQAACDADNRRERRGCELVCDFSTDSEAWYGFKLFLPEGLFPKDTDTSIIAQLFNQGRRNSWAGHLAVDKENLIVSYRPALIDPTVKVVGKLEWDKWIDVVIYYRVGRNDKGNIKVWMGENLTENNPTLDCGNISWGFAENWIDDTHFDRTPYEYDGTTCVDQIGGKWGMYVSSGGDRTLRMDNLRILEGNPAGAFNIVNPGK